MRDTMIGETWGESRAWFERSIYPERSCAFNTTGIAVEASIVMTGSDEEEKNDLGQENLTLDRGLNRGKIAVHRPAELAWMCRYSGLNQA